MSRPPACAFKAYERSFERICILERVHLKQSCKFLDLQSLL